MMGGSIAGNFASVTILVSDENGTVEVPESAMKDPLGNANGHLITGTKVKLGYADYYDTETGKPLFEQCVEVNRSDECGGGLYSRGYMEIRGGIFDNNRAQYGAAFDIRTFSSENFANAYVQSKVLGGEFKNCISLMQGSMCHIFGAILFDEYNGNGGAWIHHNSASVVGSGSGGAIYVRKNNSYAGDFTVTINKILIEENESKVWAGGISDDGNSTVTLNGGTIRNNRTTEPTLINKTEYYGGGIFVNSYAELKMSGNVNIYGNTMVVNGRSTDPTMELEEVASDINLNKGAKVYVGAFTPSTTQKIKIYGILQNQLTSGFTANNPGKKVENYFEVVREGYALYTVEGEAYIDITQTTVTDYVLIPSAAPLKEYNGTEQIIIEGINTTYVEIVTIPTGARQSGTTIVAENYSATRYSVVFKLKDTAISSGCVWTDGTTTNKTVITDGIYKSNPSIDFTDKTVFADGASKTITATCYPNKGISWSYTYAKEDGTELASAPTQPGVYFVTATANYTDNYHPIAPITAKLTLTGQLDLEVEWSIQLTYNGKPQAVTLVSTNSPATNTPKPTDFIYEYSTNGTNWSSSNTVNINAGVTYYVRATLKSEYRTSFTLANSFTSPALGSPDSSSCGEYWVMRSYQIDPLNINLSWRGVSGSSTNFAYTYNGSAQGPVLSNAGFVDNGSTFVINGANNEKITFSASAKQTVPNVNNYTRTLTFASISGAASGADTSGSNYKFSNLTRTYSIANANITATVAGNSWTYDNALHNIIASGNTATTVGGQTAVWEYQVFDGTSWGSWVSEIPKFQNVADSGTQFKVRVTATYHNAWTSGELSITVLPADISGATVGTLTDKTYNGAEFNVQGELAVSMSFSSSTATLVFGMGADYTISYRNSYKGADGSGDGAGDRTNAGTVTVTLSGRGNYTGTKMATFVINKAKITGVTWTAPSEMHYSGSAKTFTAATAGTKTNVAASFLPQSAPYTYTYLPEDSGLALVSGNAVNAGNYKVTAELKAGTAYANNFEWDNSVTNVNSRAFKIDKAVIRTADITWDNLTQDYSGTALHPTVNMGSVDYESTVDAGAKLTAADFEYTTQTNAGENQSITATLKESAAKNFTFSATDESVKSVTTNAFTITALAITITDGLAALAYVGIYDGTSHNALKDNYGDKVKLVDERDRSSVKWYYSYVNLDAGADGWTEGVPTVKDVADSSKTIWFKVEADNHVAFKGDTKVNITPKDITVNANAIKVTDKTYDGTTDVANADVDTDIDGATLFSWYYAGDDLGITFTGATYNSRNVLDANTVTVTGLALDGAAKGNYNLTATSAITAASITPLKVEIAWYVDVADDAHKGLEVVYDGNSHVAVAVISNKKNAADTDRLDVSFVAAGTVARDKADYPVTVNTPITNASGNYSLDGVDLSAVLKVIGTGFLIYREEDPEIAKLVYDGTEKYPVLYYTDKSGKKVYLDKTAFDEYEVTSGGEKKEAAIDAGSYRATIKLNQTYDWSGSISGVAGSLVREFTFDIAKATVTGLKIKGGDGVTAGSGNTFTATYTKGKAQTLGADWSEITVNGKGLADLSEEVKSAFLNADGSVKGITATVYYDGTTAERGNANESGYSVEVRFGVNGNFEAIGSLTATLVVLRREVDISSAAFGGAGFAGLSTAYDGSFKKVQVTGLPEGVTANISYWLGAENKGADGVQAIGNYTVKATFNYDAANYKLVKTAGGAEVTEIEDTLEITAKGIDLSGVQLVGDTTGTAGITYDGGEHKVIAANVPEGVTGVEYVYKNSKGETVEGNGVKDADTYTVEITYKVDANYGADQTATAEIKINPAPLTITANDVTISYGDAPNDNGATFTGLVSGDGASLFELAYEYKNKAGANYNFYAGVGEYVVEVRVSSSSTDNYTVNCVAGKLNVKKREIKVTWQNSATDGNTSFEYVYSGSEFKPYARVTNAVNGDVLTLVITGGQTDAALNCVAKVTGITGAKAENYALPAVELTQGFSVLPRPRTGVIVWDAGELYYNGQAQYPKAYYFENETDRVPKELTVTTNVSAVGAGRYTATASLGTNYELKGETTKEFEIKARKVYIKIDDATVRYSGEIDLSVLTWGYVEGSAEFVSGDAYSISFDCGAITAKGKYAIVGKFTSNNAKNYEVEFVGSWISADERDGRCGTLTVTEGAYDANGITFTGTEVTYDGQPHGITVKGLPEGVEVESVTYVKDGKIYAAKDVVKVGEYSVEIKYTSTNPNYTALTGTTVTLTIKKAALTVKANDNTITYGDDPASAGVSYTGWVNGESESVNGIISGALQYAYTYARYGGVGTYRIDVVEGCILSGNYEITFIPGTLTVEAKELSVEWFKDDNHNADELKYTYDEAHPETEYAPVAVIMGGVVNGDVVNVTVKGAKKEIGVNYTATAETDNANYVVNSTVKFSVIPSAKYTVIWDNAEITYDKTAHKPAAIYFDEAGNGKSVPEADVIITNGDGISAGKHTVTLKAGTTAEDGKALVWTAFDYEIVPAKVTVEINPVTGSVEYGKVLAWKNALGAADRKVTSGTVYGGDDLQLTFNVAADNTSGVGVYAVTAESGNRNYAVTVVSGSVTVVKAEVVMNAAVTNKFGTTAVAHTAEYDGATHEVKIEGALPEGITGVSYGYYLNSELVGAYGVKNAGTYTVKAVFTLDGNHKVSGEYTATLTITAKAAGAITMPASERVAYNGLAHALLLSGDKEAVKEVKFTYTGAKHGVVAEAVNADTYTVTAVITFKENYDASGLAGYNAVTGEVTLTGTLTVNKAQLTVKAKDGFAEYGEAAKTYGYEITGFVNGESAADNGIIDITNVSYGYKTNKDAAGTDAGEYKDEITVTLAYTSANYEVVYAGVGGTYTVTPKAVDAADVTWYESAGSATAGTEFTYKYDGATHLPVAVYKDSGITLVVSGGQSAAGDNYTAKVTDITGANAKNYTLGAVEIKVSFSITNEPVVEYEVIWDNVTHVYDNTEYKPTAYYYDGATKVVIPKEDITVAEGAAIDAGTYTAGVSANLNGKTLTNTSMTFTISKRAVYIRISDATVRYGETPNMNAVSWKYEYADEGKQFLAGERYTITFTSEATAASGVGRYAISGHFVSGNAKNYDVKFAGSYVSASASENGKYGTLTVAKAVYDMSKVTFVGTEVTYDGLAHGITLSGLPVGLTADNYECAYASAGGWSVESAVNAGVYNVTITFKGLDTENYEPVEALTATLTIKKASLIITAKDHTIVYGDEASANGIDWANAGFAGGEDESVLSGQLTYTYSYTKGANAGSYRITPSGLSSDNYEITFRAGTLTVDKKTVTVKWYYDSTRGEQPLEYRYDNGKPFAPVAVAEGLLAGDSAEITVSGAQGAVGVRITATATAISNANYKLPADGSEKTTFSILPARDNYVIWDNTRFVYDARAHKPTAFYIDEAGVEQPIEAQYISVDGGDAVEAKDGYYLAAIDEVYYNSRNLAGDRQFRFYIDPLEIEIEVLGQSAVYGNVSGAAQNMWKYAGANKFLAGVNSAVPEGATLEYLNFFAEAGNETPIGGYAITPVCTSGNYKVTYTAGTLTITKATVQMTGAVTGVFDNSGVASAANTHGYDGQTYKVEIEGELPKGITGVRYEYYQNGKLVSATGVREAGEYTVKAIFTVDGNYEEITAEYAAKLWIKQAEIDVSGVTFDATKTLVYNGEEQPVFVMGDAVGVESVEYEYYAYGESADGHKGAPLAGYPKNVGKYVVVAKFIAAENYTANGAEKEMTLEITRAQLTVVIGNKTVAYGTEAPALTANDYTVSGLLGGDTKAVLGAVSLAYENYAGKSADAGTYVISVNGDVNADNYTVKVVNGALTVTRYFINASEVKWYDENGSTAQTYIYSYDGNMHKPYAVAEIDGQTLELTVTVSGDGIAVGSYVATVTGVNGNANYEVAADINCAFVIMQQPPVDYEVVWTNTSFVYDGGEHKPTASYYDGTAVVTVPEADVTVAEGTAKDAGAYTASVTVDGKTSSVTFNITAKKVSVVIGEVQTAYGVAPDLSNVSYDCIGADKAAVAGGIRFTSTVAVNANVGTYANAIEGYYPAGGNYEVIFTSGTLRINKAKLDVSGIEFEDATVTYDGKKHAVTPTSLPAGLTATVSYYTSESGWSYDIDGVSAAGTYTVTVSLVLDESMAGNYEPVTGMTGTLIINRAPLTVTAIDNAVIYGEAPAAHKDGVTVTGFVNGEDVSVIKGKLEYSFNYDVGGSAGTYSITPSGLRADNYEVKFVSGVLTVEKRVVTISWYKDSSLSESGEFRYTYDGATEFKPHAVAGNLYGNDSAALTVSGGQVNAGLKYVATVTKISNTNYALPADGSESVSFDILPRSNVIVWENTEFIYNGLRQAPDAYYFDAAGRQQKLTVTVNNYPQQAGEYLATATAPSGVTLTGERTKKFNIKPKEIKIEILSVTAVYKKLPQFDQSGWKYVGDGAITDGNYIILSCPITSMTDPDAGSYPITARCISDNYVLVVTNANRQGTYTIVRQEIPVPAPAGKAYTGGTLTADLEHSDMYSVIQNMGGVAVGKYPVTFALNAAYARNYKWAGTEEYYLTVDFEITRAENEFTTPFEMNWTVDTSDTSLGKNEPKAAFGTPQIAFYYDEGCTRVADESYILGSATPGMTFWVRVTVEGTENYTGLEFKHSILIVGDRALALCWETFSAVYDGQAHAPQAYVSIEGRKVYLKVTVDREAVHAGEYTATALFEAVDGTSLAGYKLHVGEPSEDTEIKFVISPREVRVEIGDLLGRVYGTPAVNADRLLSKNVYGTVVGNDDIGIKFTTEYEEVNGYVPVGRYAITGSWTNTDYTVIFFGNWEGNETVEAQTAGVYEVIPADITVKKSGSEWFDQDDVYDKNQPSLVSLAKRNDEDTEYVNITLKGDLSAKATITYSFLYEYDDSKVMTDEMIKSFIVEGNTAVPEIRQAGDWVVYYRITEQNHNVKYGQWVVRIRKNTEFIVVTFKKAFTMQYGDTVFGTDLMPQLIDTEGNSEYIELGAGLEGMTLLQLRKIAKAYAYEDVTSNMGFVGGDTAASRYCIRFVLRDEYAGEYDGVEFKYSDSNDKADSNLDKYEVTRRGLTLEWGTTSFTYDGAEHIPTATLKGLVGGETVELKDVVLGEAYTLQLKNGDVMNVTVRLYQGANVSGAGAFMLMAEIDNANYELKQGAIVTVNVLKRALEIVWGETSFNYDGASHIPTATIKGFAGGEEITLTDIVLGEVKEVTLASGEVIKLRVTLISGSDTVNGNYGLRVEVVDSGDYELQNGSVVTVTITDNSKVALPNWAIYAIIGAAAFAVLLVIILIAVLRKRGKNQKSMEGLLDEDGFMDDYNA